MFLSSSTPTNGARALLAGAAALLVSACSTVTVAQPQAAETPELSTAQAPTYADLVTMAMAADTAARTPG